VVRPADPPEEERDDLVTDDLVDEPVAADDRFRGEPVEMIEEGVELGRSHLFAHRGRAADVGEKQRDGHLDPAHPVLAELAQALDAERLIARRAREPDVTEDEAADSRKRRSAQLSARRGRQPSKDAPALEQACVLPNQSRADLFCRHGLVRHAPNLRRDRSSVERSSSGYASGVGQGMEKARKRAFSRASSGLAGAVTPRPSSRRR